MNMICKDCRFWVRGSDQPRNSNKFKPDEGECRRHSPTGGGITAFFSAEEKPTKMVATHFPWPLSHEDDWCGEYIGLDAR